MYETLMHVLRAALGSGWLRLAMLAVLRKRIGLPEAAREPALPAEVPGTSGVHGEPASVEA